MGLTWESAVTSGHSILATSGADLGQFGYGLIVVCECGDIFTAVSGNRMNAEKIARAKYRKHLTEDK